MPLSVGADGLCLRSAKTKGSEMLPPHVTRPGQAQTRGAAALPQRTYELAAQRADGTRWIWQTRAPALPLFDSAFSAFGRGIVMPTADGPVAVEDLVPGDKVQTLAGDLAPVVWIGSTTFVPADMGQRISLVRITAAAFGMTRPASSHPDPPVSHLHGAACGD